MDVQLINLRRLWGGYMAARVVITANNLGVFDRLTRARTAAQMARLLKADLRATEILLDALTGVGVVTKTDGRYRNGPAADRYLVCGKPLYQGDILRHNHNMWQSWSELDDVVQTGRPARRGGFDHEAFIMGMHNLSVLRVHDVLRAVGLRRVQRFLDLGGGPGTFGIEVARRGIKATVFDLPETIPIAKKVARKAGVKGIRYLAGDFHSDPIGRGYDLILISQIFHAYPVGDNLSLLRKCREALGPDGRVAVHEFPINEERTAPPLSALFSVNMLVNTQGGRTYTPGEMSRWLTETGFSHVRVKPLQETVVLTARKSGRP